MKNTFHCDAHLDVYIKEGNQDERAFLCIDDSNRVVAGDCYEAGHPASNMLFVLIQEAEKLTFDGKPLKQLVVRDGEFDDACDGRGCIEVWLYF